MKDLSLEDVISPCWRQFWCRSAGLREGNRTLLQCWTPGLRCLSPEWWSYTCEHCGNRMQNNGGALLCVSHQLHTVKFLCVCVTVCEISHLTREDSMCGKTVEFRMCCVWLNVTNPRIILTSFQKESATLKSTTSGWDLYWVASFAQKVATDLRLT